MRLRNGDRGQCYWVNAALRCICGRDFTIKKERKNEKRNPNKAKHGDIRDN